MQSIRPSDLLPLDQSPLWWRWSQPQTTILPAEVVHRVRALRVERAADLNPRAAFLCDARRRFDVEIPTTGDPALVRGELQQLGVRSTEQVIVSWDARTAVVTDWATFCAHWDDFCYPRSDDVTVWPTDEAWVLCYDHWEAFRFGRLIPVA